MQCVATLSWTTCGGAARAFGPKDRIARDAGSRSSSAAQAATATPQVSSAATQVLARRGGELLDNVGAQLVRRCIDGDSSAWAEMVRTHHKRVYGLCYRLTGNPADAEDVTQDVFLKIYSNLAAFNATKGSLQVWITTVTRNLLVDTFRRNRNAPCHVFARRRLGCSQGFEANRPAHLPCCLAP